MRYKEIDINIKAIPDAEDEAILNQLIGNKKLKDILCLIGK